MTVIYCISASLNQYQPISHNERKIHHISYITLQQCPKFPFMRGLWSTLHHLQKWTSQTKTTKLNKQHKPMRLPAHVGSKVFQEFQLSLRKCNPLIKGKVALDSAVKDGQQWWLVHLWLLILNVNQLQIQFGIQLSHAHAAIITRRCITTTTCACRRSLRKTSSESHVLVTL